MKTVVIGDIHGRHIWNDILDKENADRIIFIGDYFDSFDISGGFQIYNFKEILRYKNEHPDKEVVMLIGNHDFSYLPGMEAIPCSGHQGGIKGMLIKQIISHNVESLKMAYGFDDFVFTHAGVSSVWLQENGYKNENIVDFINDIYQYKPLQFAHNGTNGYGDDIYQTPIWIRPPSLMKVNHGTLREKIIQIVGHTGQSSIDIKGKATGGRYFFIDTLGSSQEYLIIEDGNISIGILNKIKI